jgi:transposase-like protein
MVKDDPGVCQLVLPDRQKRILERVVRRTHCPQAIALRARVVLSAAEGRGMSQVAREVGCSRELARRWRDRFAGTQVQWGTAAECGRPVTHWTPRELADEAVKRKIVSSISPRHVGRFLKKSTSVRVIKRGNFTSTTDLREKILAFIEYFNHTMAKAFKWTYKGKPLTA